MSPPKKFTAIVPECCGRRMNRLYEKDLNDEKWISIGWICRVCRKIKMEGDVHDNQV